MKIFALAFFLLLAACSTPSIDITTKPADLGPLNVPKAAPMILNDVTWNVITKDNINDFINKNPTTGMFALTPDVYNKLAGNMVEIKRYIQDLQSIIDYMNGYIIKMRSIETQSATSNTGGK